MSNRADPRRSEYRGAGGEGPSGLDLIKLSPEKATAIGRRFGMPCTARSTAIELYHSVKSRRQNAYVQQFLLYHGLLIRVAVVRSGR
jgi:hypothetical protein